MKNDMSIPILRLNWKCRFCSTYFARVEWWWVITKPSGVVAVVKH